MEIVYILYAILALVAIVLNCIIFVLRIRRQSNSQLQGASDEHRWCLVINDILIIVASAVVFISLLQDLFQENVALCQCMGFANLYVILTLSWTPLMTTIVLYEKERYSLRVKSYQGMTPRIVSFVIGAMLVISAALVSINYAPIIEFNSER